MNQIKHLGVIMDGNRRWAKAQGLISYQGHNRGAEVFGDTCDWCLESNIEYLTVYAFSTENWKRSIEEITHIFKLLAKYFIEEKDTCLNKGIRITIIGERSHFDKKTMSIIEEIEAYTKNCSKLKVQIALSYGGRDEIVRAVNKLLVDIKDGNGSGSCSGNGSGGSNCSNNGSGSLAPLAKGGMASATSPPLLKGGWRQQDLRRQGGFTVGGQEGLLRGNDNGGIINIAQITEEIFASYLDTAGIPDVDLVIRTGGAENRRLSNFLPWQTVYSELYFSDLLWPDFSRDEFENAIEYYNSVKRKLGK